MKALVHVMAVMWTGMSFSSWAQFPCEHPSPSSPATVLWKISGKTLSQPSYLLGTMHLMEVEWLYEHSQILTVLDHTEYLLTEAFTTQSNQPSVKASLLKALPLLTPSQYNTLDSFFVARIGEGIKHNPEAEAMTVTEMETAILTVLTASSSKPDGLTRFMDLDLFKRYESQGRQAERLDRIPFTAFDSTTTDQAKAYLSRSLKYIKNSDKPSWNVYGIDDADQARLYYRQMKFDYQLDQQPTPMEHSSHFDFIPIEQRNKNWIPKIIRCLSSKPCLIAVGIGHLFYRTGVISLLRNQGYTVEPIYLTKTK